MADFGIRFSLCNILICIVIVIFLMAKRVLKSCLTSRMQFNLWFPLLGLLAVPFLPFRLFWFSQILLWLEKLKHTTAPNMKTITETTVNINASGTAKQISDFTLSVSSKTPSIIGLILFGIWIVGIFAMLLSAVKSKAHLNLLKKSALPLQNREVRMLYNNCLSEMKIKKDIPIYSSAFLKSPIITGLFKPCIYLPIHLISDFHITADRHNGILEEGFHTIADRHNGILEEGFHTIADRHNGILEEDKHFNASDIRYILLHELQHYKHKDSIAGCLMNLIGILYWFNPFVWYALKEMHADREIACDTSVLKLLDENDYEDYGNTLINFTAKVSLMPFPFTSGISGAMKQMEKRIVNISSYKKPSVWKKIKGTYIFALAFVMLLGFAPILSTYAAEQSYYNWDISSKKIEFPDLSSYFHGYEGSFVLYDLKNDAWNIYDMEHATLRTTPNSTYKIYDALFGLEEGIITPENSFMAWNGDNYPFKAWNADQDLYSAMRSSVNWYFQEIDKQLGASTIRNYMKKIGYGNETVDSDLSVSPPDGTKGCPDSVSPFWMQSALKISPVEQVALLTDLYNNRFGFAPEHINAVKDSIRLSPSSLRNSRNERLEGSFSETDGFFGKTGTGRINENDINGWFIGYIETADNTYFFATNIQSTENATGSKAYEISLSVLSDMKIWKQ